MKEKIMSSNHVKPSSTSIMYIILRHRKLQEFVCEVCEYMLLWDTVKGSPPDPKGENPYSPYSGFIQGTLVFTHYIPARQRYSPHGMVMTESRQCHLKSNQDGY